MNSTLGVPRGTTLVPLLYLAHKTNSLENGYKFFLLPKGMYYLYTFLSCAINNVQSIYTCSTPFW